MVVSVSVYFQVFRDLRSKKSRRMTPIKIKFCTLGHNNFSFHLNKCSNSSLLCSPVCGLVKNISDDRRSGVSLDSAGRSLFGDDTKPYSSNLEGFYRNKYHLQDIFGISGGINLTYHFPSRNQICTEKLVSNDVKSDVTVPVLGLYCLLEGKDREYQNG